MELVHDKNNTILYLKKKNDPFKEIGELSYSYVDQDILQIDSIWIEKDYRGNDFAAYLTKYIISFAKDHNLKIIPACAFAKSYFKRYHKIFSDILAN